VADLDPDIIRVTKRALGWSFYCRYCDFWSGQRKEESRARKEATNHLKTKSHAVFTNMVMKLRGKQ